MARYAGGSPLPARTRHSGRAGLAWGAGKPLSCRRAGDSARAGESVMFREIELLSPGQVAELKRIAASANFVDGRISNPHSQVKQNLQLHDEAAYNRSSQILTQALYAHEDFENFAFPVAMLPPMMARYTNEMRYGAHADGAFLQLG